MRKRAVKDMDMADSSTLNRISPAINISFNVLFILFALICIIPVVFVFIISISSEQSIKLNGYRFWPQEFSLESYLFLWKEGKMIIRALGISAAVTVAGTAFGVILTTLMGYVLSIRKFKFNSFFTMVVFIPMIFNGGMISSYVINTQFLHLKNTLWALILPLCVSSFHVIICKTFFKLNIPESIVESAQIDGASHFTIFARIAFPLSKPIVATIALFLSFAYWNDWFQSSLYITDTKLFSIQSLLDHIQRNMEMMAKNPSLGVTLQQYMNNMPKEGARMAMAIIIIVPIACTYPFFQRYFISGLTVGAVKG
ncbi:MULTISPECIES: carbohydrate ABC transporter permease [Lacrimispora]|uniref:Aldouronate transport system permease protein n=1 Tax=Lacrimispora sphenoides JCM 1415 TaxID=1297793 RepID=A0ABY1C2M1_9FIRM|nr:MULTISPECIES: carbohydrate ABC transporter permease [Lacrimispora]MDR7810455.1 carbohydrate ABC transporter permease [Lacrimispora sp.]SET57367.1 putative aldouronate transport system permease protein [[Clostridium] sphenoides JCM 1415]SUY49839.1 binding-protein-dependent transport system inner membrane protein [Lacrimispora sphenoides]